MSRTRGIFTEEGGNAEGTEGTEGREEAERGERKTKTRRLGDWETSDGEIGELVGSVGIEWVRVFVIQRRVWDTLGDVRAVYARVHVA